jgi:hypothetical protein
MVLRVCSFPPQAPGAAIAGAASRLHELVADRVANQGSERGEGKIAHSGCAVSLNRLDVDIEKARHLHGLTAALNI